MRYRKYLEEAYSLAIYKDRLRRIYPSAENRGRFAANEVTFEFILPAETPIPTDEQLLLFDIYEEYGEQPPHPEEPEPFSDIMSSLSLGSRLLFPNAFSEAISPMEQSHNDIDGPNYNKMGDTTHIKYKVSQLIPHLPENDFDPMEVWLGDIVQDSSYSIPVRIFAANLPEPETEILHLEIQISNESEPIE